MLGFGHRSFACGRLRDVDNIVRGALGHREEAGLLHFGHAFFESSDDLFDIGDAMGCRQERREAFKDMDPLGAHEVVEETGKSLLWREAEVEDAPKVLNPRRHVFLFEELVQRAPSTVLAMPDPAP